MTNGTSYQNHKLSRGRYCTDITLNQSTLTWTMEEEQTIIEVPEASNRGPGDGLPREPGKSSETEGASATESANTEDGPWNEMDILRGHLVALQSGFMSDLTVIVEEEKFRCHTYILGVASQKLAAMLKPNQNELHLSGVTSTNFRILLEIMYSGAAKELQTDLAKTLQIRRDANLLQVYKAAAYCTKLLRKQLDAQNVCTVLDEPLLMNDTDLEACIKVIQEQTDRVLKSDSFLKCNVATLEIILKQEVVYNVTELEIYLAFTCWVMAQEQPIKNLESALSHIRFQAIQPIVAKIHLTTLMGNVRRNLLRCVAAAGEIPSGFSNKNKRRTTWNVARVHPDMEETITLDYYDGFTYRTIEQQLSVPPLRILADEDVFLIGVIARTQRAHAFSQNKYTEGANLILKDEKEKLISTATFSGELKNSDEYQVEFPQPVVLYAGTTYTLHFLNIHSKVQYGTRKAKNQNYKLNSISNFYLLDDGETPIQKIILNKIF